MDKIVDNQSGANCDPFDDLLEKLQSLTTAFNDDTALFDEDRHPKWIQEIEKQIMDAPAQDLDGILARLAFVQAELKRVYDIPDDEFLMVVLGNAVRRVRELSSDDIEDKDQEYR